jgi:iron(III) transport system permease protein
MPVAGGGRPALRPEPETLATLAPLPPAGRGPGNGTGASLRCRRAAQPTGLLAISILVAGVLILPLVFLLVEAQGAGVSKVASLIDRSLTAQLLWNTARLAVVVTALCAVIGTGAAWLWSGPTCRAGGCGRC